MSDDKRKFQVDPRDIIRHAVREHEQQHGYFNVADEMVNKLENEIRIWYEFERRHECGDVLLDILTEEPLRLPVDIGSISPLGSRMPDSVTIASTPALEVPIPSECPIEEDADEGI